MDGIGRESLEPELEPFMYKGEIEIPALGMVDDLLTISESGYKTTRLNSFINAKIAIKKLQLGPQKCFVMHTKKDHEDFKNTELFVDGWKMRSVKNLETGQMERNYTFEGDMDISHINEERYLGQIINSVMYTNIGFPKSVLFFKFSDISKILNLLKGLPSNAESKQTKRHCTTRP